MDILVGAIARDLHIDLLNKIYIVKILYRVNSSQVIYPKITNSNCNTKIKRKMNPEYSSKYLIFKVVRIGIVPNKSLR